MVNFPGSLDSLSNPSSNTKRNAPGFELHVVISTLNDIAELLEAKLGTGASTPTANNVLRGTGAGSSAWGKIANADVDAAAAIAYSKLALTGAILAGDLAVTAAMKKIASGSPSGGQIAFTGIPATYKSLRLVLTGRSTENAVNTALSLRLGTGGSGDSGANYDYQRMRAQATTQTDAEAFAQNQLDLGFVTGDSGSAPANASSSLIVDLPDYANAAYEKTIEHYGCVKYGVATGTLIKQVTSGFWRNTGAIACIEINLAAGNWKAGSACTLYGLPA